MKEDKNTEQEIESLIRRNKELEELVEQQRNERLQIFENAVVGVALTYNGIFLDVNNTFAQMIGYEKQEVVGSSISSVTHPSDVHLGNKDYVKLNKKEIDNFTIRKRYMRKDGTYFWGLTQVNNVSDLKGNIKYHLCIISNVHNEELTQRKLNLTVDNLKELNASLEQFAHVVSHDLKAPLNGIHAIVEWLKMKDLDSESQEYIELLDDRAQKMNLLINKVFEETMVQKENEQRERIESESFISETIKMFPLPENLKVELKGKFPELYMNPRKLQQIFGNLIENSIRFSNKNKGLIRIEAHELTDFYQFKVFDNGIGIEEDRYHSIFNLPQKSGAEEESRGVGLNLVKRFIEQYGGKIKVHSEPGLFTEFSFTLGKEETSKTS